MNIFSGLLFLHGHVTNAALARQLASPSPTPTPPPAAPLVVPAAGRQPRRPGIPQLPTAGRHSP